MDTTRAAMASDQKANGPAEAATSPDHGSTNPQKESSVNIERNTTAPAQSASTCAGALARLVGIHDRPGVSGKFAEAGWYAIGRGTGSCMRVMYAEPDRGGHLPGFIDLSDGPGERVRFSLSPDAFDYACWGQCFTAAEAERRAV